MVGFGTVDSWFLSNGQATRLFHFLQQAAVCLREHSTNVQAESKRIRWQLVQIFNTNKQLRERQAMLKDQQGELQRMLQLSTGILCDPTRPPRVSQGTLTKALGVPARTAAAAVIAAPPRQLRATQSARTLPPARIKVLSPSHVSPLPPRRGSTRRASSATSVRGSETQASKHISGW
eukprot:TRINITY_DN4555_c0_g1_i1.p3 TRINITY_DN4555_c0_g1~~TRINITY_DN4555_c0_g1_i1.p3  ORF type:complete len:177 (+),score=17.06 TRINITY_DN4555_c0_g1_i1:777-1307(+)